MTAVRVVLFAIMAIMVSRFGIFHSSAQSKFSTFTDATWSPDGSMVALFDVTLAIDTVHVFTDNLDLVASFSIVNIPDEVRQVDGLQLSWSPDSTRLAVVFHATDNFVVSETYTVVWGVHTGSEMVRLKNEGLFVAWSPSGRYLATGIRIIDAANGDVVQRLGDFSTVHHVIWHPTNETRVLISFDTNVAEFDTASGEVTATYPAHFASRPAFSPDGMLLAVERSSASIGIDVLCASNFELMSSINLDSSLIENDPVYWIDSQSIAVKTVNQSIVPIIDVMTGHMVDKVSINRGNVWNADGTHFLVYNPVIDHSETLIAILDTETEVILAQLPLSPTRD